MTKRRKTRRAGCLVTAVAALVAAVPARAEPDSLPTITRWEFALPVKTLHVTSAEDLGHLFTAHDYDLPAVRDGRPLPRVYLRRLVRDLNGVAPVAERERLFIQIVLPLIARTNAKIAEERRTLEAIAATAGRGERPTAAQDAWLRILAGRYGGNPMDMSGLLVRVDTVPAALAIAQAIDESGWGTAPLALETNGIFGEHATIGANTVEAAGGYVAVAAFPSLLDGVLAYMTNINSNRAYATLRTLRARHRREGRHPDGYALAEGLRDYSVRGMAYVEDLRRLMRAYKLRSYDKARLASGTGVTMVQPGR